MASTRFLRLVACALALAVAAYAAPVRAETTLTLWSMGGDQPKWVEWINVLVERFEKKHPGSKVKVTWYEKMALSAALKTALRAGQGPDIIYGEPDQSEYADAGYLMPLDAVVNWQNIEPWARGAWSSKGHSWGSPLGLHERDLLQQGSDEEARRQHPAERAGEPGGVPGDHQEVGGGRHHAIALGTGDRPFPGAYLSFEPMLRKLGPQATGSSSRATSRTATRASSRC